MKHAAGRRAGARAAGFGRLIGCPVACVLLFLTGCAHYEYDVVEPAGLAGRIGGDAWLAMRRDDLEYRMRSADNRLVVLVYNRGEAPVKLLGADSAAVDARGESHPLQSATIPPGSYTKRIFPPPPPTLQRSGPAFGVGVGVGGAFVTHFRPGPGPYRYPGYFYPGGFTDVEPRYYSVYDPNDRSFFEWPGQTSVRFLFTFGREGGGTVRQEWVIRKVKA